MGERTVIQAIAHVIADLCLRHVSGEVHVFLRRTSFLRAVTDKMIVAVTEISMLQRRHHIRMGLPVELFGKEFLRIEKTRGLVGQVMMQGTRIVACCNFLPDLGIARQIPDRIEIPRDTPGIGNMGRQSKP